MYFQVEKYYLVFEPIQYILYFVDIYPTMLKDGIVCDFVIDFVILLKCIDCQVLSF